MKFRFDNGEMSLVKENILEDMKKSKSSRKAVIVDMPMIKKKIKGKGKEYLDNQNGNFAIMPVGLVLGVATGAGGAGVFWETFMKWIFPYMMDIAKVFCLIKIAQSFYSEQRGGRESGSGFGAFVTYGKWYILLALTPWIVELFDEIGDKMLTELRTAK